MDTHAFRLGVVSRIWNAHGTHGARAMAVAQLVMRGFSRLEAVEALTALGDEDIETAHEWLMDRRGGMAT